MTTLRETADTLLSAYRTRYGNLARGGVRKDAPLQREMGELAAAVNDPAATRSDVNIVEMCAKEIEWMARGHAAHEAAVLIQGAARLRNEASKIVLRASRERV